MNGIIILDTLSQIIAVRRERPIYVQRFSTPLTLEVQFQMNPLFLQMKTNRFK